MTEDAKPPDPDRTWPIRWIVLVYVLLLALNVWLLWFLPDAPASEKASFVLTLVGFYSLALNFSKGSGLVQSFPSWLEDMTSPSLRDFAAGSFRVLSVVFAMASLFVRGFPPPILSPLGILGALAALPLAFVVVAVTFVTGFAYLIVIVPLAYVAYLLASLVVDAVESAPGEVSLDSDEGHLAVKGAVRNHKAELKTLVVGVPATVLGIGTTAWSLFP
jgi:hypothetical protein